MKISGGAGPSSIRVSRAERILREDEETRRTGVFQPERQGFELVREHLGLDRAGGAT
jgi:hypothetical protein